MKKTLIKTLLLALTLCMTATSAFAQRDRNYVKNAIRKWGNCKNVALTRTNGDVALRNRCDYAASNVPSNLLTCLKRLHNSNTLIDDVQLTENGRWCVLYGKNDAEWTNNSPQGLIDKIQEYHRNNYTVRSITFNDYNEWVIVSDSYYATSSTDLTNWLRNGTNKYGKLWAVCITNDAAVAVYANGFCYRGNVPEDLKAALRSTSFNVYRLKIAGSSWFFADTNGNYRYYM